MGNSRFSKLSLQGNLKEYREMRSSFNRWLSSWNRLGFDPRKDICILIEEFLRITIKIPGLYLPISHNSILPNSFPLNIHGYLHISFDAESGL
jgi:hypothetical protein